MSGDTLPASKELTACVHVVTGGTLRRVDAGFNWKAYRCYKCKKRIVMPTEGKKK
jgi:hypothetical protein